MRAKLGALVVQLTAMNTRDLIRDFIEKGRIYIDGNEFPIGTVPFELCSDLTRPVFKRSVEIQINKAPPTALPHVPLIHLL